MNNIEALMNKGILNRIWFKFVILVAVMVTAVPYLHQKVGGYVKFILLYGIIIILYELVTKQLFVIFKDKMNIILLLFCISYFFTIIVNRDSNLGSNLKALVYMVVFFLLLHMTTKEVQKEDLLREIRFISATVVVCTFILSLACFYMYMFSLSGKYWIDTGIMYYGMYDNRLWGVYNANTGSTLNCISIILSATFLVKPSRKVYAIFNIGNIILQYICLLLTGSRAALYVLLLLLIIVTIVSCIQRHIKLGEKRKLKTCAVCVVTIGLVIAVFGGSNAVTKDAISYVPGIVKGIHNFFDDEKEEFELEKEDLERLEEVEGREGGFFTGRTELWSASLQALKENPIWGVTRENLYEKSEPYLENEIWAKNLRVGGTHNIYVCILVSSGIVGFVLMAIFASYLMIKGAMKVIKNIGNINEWMLTIFLLMILFFVTEFVEARILYQVNVFNVLFWIYCGYFMQYLKLMDNEETRNEFYKNTIK